MITSYASRIYPPPHAVSDRLALAAGGTASEHGLPFLEEVESIVRANFDNPDFNMSRLSADIGICRAGFYNKMKEIAGMTPNEFTRAVKLREAAELLKTTHLQVSEIADRLGFYSTKHLSKYFKTFYGATPSQWRKDNAYKHHTYETKDAPLSVSVAAADTRHRM